MTIRKKFLLISFASSALLAAISSLAQTTVYWDTNGNTAGASAGTTAAGTWNNNTTADWTTSAAGTSGTSRWNSITGGSKNATFSAGTNATGTFTVTVSGTVTNVGGLTFQDGTVTLGGAGTLDLTGTAAVNVQTTQANISAILGSTGGLDKTGTGILNLSGANTFTGGVTVSAGTLSIGSDGNLGATTNGVTLNGGTLQTTGTLTADPGRIFTIGSSGGTMDVSSGQTFTLGTAAQLTGSGDLTKTSAGTLAISATNSGFTGNTNVNGGVLRLSTYDGLGTSTTNTLTLNNGAELEAAFANNTNFQSNIVINDGSIVRTNTTGNKSGFQNNAANSTLTINGTAQITDQDGTGGTGGFVTLDGVVQLNTGGNLTATATNAADEVRFGGGQSITLAAGSSITTAGNGLVSFGSGAARTIIAEGTSAQQATINLGAATNTANTGTVFQINGSGTGGLRIAGTNTKVDGLMTDARLAAVTGSGGTLTIAYTNAGSRTLTSAANLTVASGVILGLESNGGTFTVGAAGGGTHDLGNWGGLQVGANTTVKYADNNVFAAGSSLTMLGGTLNLNNTIQNIGTLTITGNSVIDFAGGASTFNVTNLFITAGSTLSIINWQNSVDTFTAANWAGATFDTSGSSPMNQIVFSGFTGSNTHWASFDDQVTPVPEPSTYGAILLAALLGFFAWRRFQANREQLTLRPIPIEVRRHRD
jgi:autotransporter-associated beta strand protein